MALFAFGSNEHRQIYPSAPLHVNSPLRLEGCSQVVAASWSQVIVRDANGKHAARGLPLENSFANLSAVISWLGHDEFLAVLLDDGRIQRLSDGALTESKYAAASMNSRGELVVVPDSQSCIILLYPSLSALFDDTVPTIFELPFYPSSSSAPEHVSSISSGASHFIILVSPSARVFSLGDNRYGQLGVSDSTRASPSEPVVLHHVDQFDGLQVSRVSAGSFHSVALTEGGQVYLFGSDERGQCGGSGGGSEPLLDETLETCGEGLGDGSDDAQGGQIDDDDDDDEIVEACAFGESTMVRNRRGQVWVAGSDHSGQLGLGSSTSSPRDPVSTFVKHPNFGPRDDDTNGGEEGGKQFGRVTKIVCSRWTTYLQVEEG